MGAVQPLVGAYQRQEKIKKTRKDTRIFEKFRGIKNISCIKSAKKRVLIPKVKSDRGDTITSKKKIAKIFGEFYSKLFAGDETEGIFQIP